MSHNTKQLSEYYFVSRMRTGFLILLVSLIVSGCLGRKSAPARYYTLDYPAGVQVNITGNTGPVQKSCVINSVEVYPAYSTSQIAIRENTHEIRYFVFNQWAVRPEQSFTAIMQDFINDHNIFGSVYTSIHPEPDYTLETKVYHLELIEENNNYHARLKLEFRLNDSQTGEEILNHRADRKHLLEERNLNLFAAAVSEIFIEELAVFAGSILTELK